jgi:hypothetical protein
MLSFNQQATRPVKDLLRSNRITEKFSTIKRTARMELVSMSLTIPKVATRVATVQLQIRRKEVQEISSRTERKN